jgi:hypothetical protein
MIKKHPDRYLTPSCATPEEDMIQIVRNRLLQFQPAMPDYVTHVLGHKPQPRKRPGRPRGNPFVNKIICEAVELVVRHGFPATRNEATATPSACSIVAQALGKNGVTIGEAAVVKIWQRSRFGIRDPQDPRWKKNGVLSYDSITDTFYLIVSIFV